ncbi:ankyrin repeat domain-containing protein [Salinibacter ruber]|uniref:ankyrin repeat domain-containing protein n=1 Tax=Salinibacter ruber TaxID=146919 RepID=UPI002168BCAC|nr:ankyrin repeat domain-containing protein [Salinibacter ruber]MCS3639221.1 ankyrin repeat protein [Salinibacter ruber]
MHNQLLLLSLLLLIPQTSVGQDPTPAEAKQKLQDQGRDLSRSSYESAIVDGEDDIVRLYLEAGYPANGTIETGSIELTYLEMTFGDHPEVTKALLQYGADPNKPGVMGSYPIHQAIPHARSMQLLIENGAKIRATNNLGFKPIHSAIIRDTTTEVQTRAVRILLNHGADPNSQVGEGDIEGATPLLICATRGRPSVAQVLLENGAAPNLDDSPLTLEDGQTLSDLARSRGNISTAEIIDAYEN